MASASDERFREEALKLRLCETSFHKIWLISAALRLWIYYLSTTGYFTHLRQ
jgi:hypothetical protein